MRKYQTDQNGSSAKLVRKAPLKLVAPTKSKPKQFRAGGLEPSDSMLPGEYHLVCESAMVTLKGGKSLAVIAYGVMVGPHQGTELLQWIEIKHIDGVVQLKSRYGEHCKIALGREIEPGDDLSPAAVFPGRFFLAAVGYRMTEKTGGAASKELTRRRKDSRDFLRVHTLIELEESPC